MNTKCVIHVAGWKACVFFQKAANVITALEHLYPGRVVADIQKHESRELYKMWLENHGSDGSGMNFVESLGPRAAIHRSSPFVWLNDDDFIGGCDDTMAYVKENFMSMSRTSKPLHVVDDSNTLEGHGYDYDLVVIGGGSGGLACAKGAAVLGPKVCVLDFVEPSPLGSTWGLGGTCVNVGCIPKKLFHQGSQVGELMKHDSANFGWKLEGQKFDWPTLVSNVQDYIHGLNFKHRVDLRKKNVTYENFRGSFTDPHTLSLTNPTKGNKSITARRFVIAVGGRPRPLTCPGAALALTSDDIFQHTEDPGKVLVVGASYVALECAGFLNGLGYSVTILVRSILLRGFDQDMANRIGAYMETEGVKFIRECVPSNIEEIDEGLKVSWTGSKDPTIFGEGVFNTVLNATGRDPDIKQLGLDKAGVALNPKTGRVLVKNEQTNVPHIYAIGDVIDAPELTPVAILAGKLLSKRLYGGSKVPMDYDKVCTSVFTPIEYGSCGKSEEEATAQLGSNLEVYHQGFTPLEWSLSHERAPDTGYVKVLCDKADSMRVVGFHYLGPNAGEVTQGVGIAMKMNATFQDFLDTVGIHPTTAETFTKLSVTKSSGESASGGSC